MTAFSPSTSYRNEYEFHDFIEIARYQPPPGGLESDEAFGLRVKLFDASAPDIQNIALSLGLAAEDSVLLVWNPSTNNEQPPFDPKSGGMMVLTDSGNWVISNVRKSRFGHYEMGVTKAVENAGA